MQRKYLSLIVVVGGAILGLSWRIEYNKLGFYEEVHT